MGKRVFFIAGLLILCIMFSSMGVAVSSGQAEFEGSINPSATNIFGDVAAGRANTMKINKEGLPLTELSFIVNKDTYDIPVTVEAVSEQDIYIEKINAPVFSYIKITKSGRINDREISGIRIKFKVLKSWLLENNIDGENVYAAFFNGAGWEKAASTSLEGTAMTGNAVYLNSRIDRAIGSRVRDWILFPLRWLAGLAGGYVVYAPSDYEYYVSEIGRMSYIAITGTSTIIEPENVIVPGETTQPVQQELIEEKPYSAGVSFNDIATYFLILVFLGIVVAGVIYKRKKGRK